MRSSEPLVGSCAIYFCSLRIPCMFSSLRVLIMHSRTSSHYLASRAHSPVRNRSLGTDAPEDDAGAIAVVPEDATEVDQQQPEGKQLSILTPANLFW